MSESFIDRVNRLCEHAFENLPEGYQLALVVRNGEAWLELDDENGDAVEFQVDDESCWEAACDAAKEHAKQMKEEEET